MTIALWNERDPFLKERLYGLANEEGNHGEDVKEYYYYLDGVPSHAFMRMLYKYPQVEYPYRLLLEENRRRGRASPEFELIDAIGGAFTEGRYFDVFIEYAKAAEDDILCKVTAHNRGPEPAPLHLLPHIWFRNTWSWGYSTARSRARGYRADGRSRFAPAPGRALVVSGHSAAHPALLFTNNETNFERLFGVPNAGRFVKDAFHDAIVGGLHDRLNADKRGSKAAAHYSGMVAPGESLTVRTRFTNHPHNDPFGDFDATVERRVAETDEFYQSIQPPGLEEDERRVQRQAFAGLLWTKQFYHYSVELWLDGDPAGPKPPAGGSVAETRIGARI